MRISQARLLLIVVVELSAHDFSDRGLSGRGTQTDLVLFSSSRTGARDYLI